jgi:hypothetical protein
VGPLMKIELYYTVLDLVWNNLKFPNNYLGIQMSAEFGNDKKFTVNLNLQFCQEIQFKIGVNTSNVLCSEGFRIR